MSEPRSRIVETRKAAVTGRFHLSHANAGSYWEAGYAEGLGKPVIYTCERSVFDGKSERISKPHFDTNHHLTIIWDAADPQKVADQLTETVRFTIPEARQEKR